MDTIKGVALIATFIGFLAMCAALVHWHAERLSPYPSRH